MAYASGDSELPTFSFRGTSMSDAPNPLRPYYIPPSIGFPDDAPGSGGNGSRIPPPSSRSSFPAAARELFIDYESFAPERDSSGIADMARRLVDQAIWSYTSVLLAQPFEVAKIVLQCHQADSTASANRLVVPATPGRGSLAGVDRRDGYFDFEEEEEEDSDSDAPSYFTPTAPYETPSSPRSNRRRRRPPSRSMSATPTPSSHSAAGAGNAYSLELKRNDSILEVLSQLWSREGAWGVWKGTNSTFVYNILLRAIESWTRSLLSAMCDLPDIALSPLGSVAPAGGTLGILDSPNPVASIAVAVGAAGIAGLVLAPIDLIRTRLILTPTTATPRALLPCLRSIPSLLCPPSLTPITILHSTIPTFFSTAGPLLLRTWLYIDPISTPSASTLATILLSLTELFAKLPLETVMRRGHISHLSASATRLRMTVLSQSTNSASSSSPRRDDPTHLRTIVPVGPFRGVAGTMWHIVREEGSRIPVSERVNAALAGERSRRQQPPRKGQGVQGLWRGWRVGFWGIVGMWVAGAVGGGGDGSF